MGQQIGVYKEKRSSRKKKWCVRWLGDYSVITGKQTWYSKQFATRAEAEDFVSAKRKEFESGLPRDKGRSVTLGEFLSEWLAARQQELRASTIELYEGAIDRLKTCFGSACLLTDINEQKAESFIAKQKILSKSRQGEPLNDWTRNLLKRQCRTIFGKAVSWNLIRSNPFQNIKLKKPSIKRWHRLVTAEYLKLLDAAPNLRWKAFYAVAYTAGLRMGELFALQWGDVDFEKNTITVASREGTDRTPPFEVKDSESRLIPVPAHTISILAQWQAQAPQGVPYVMLDDERYQLVLAKWRKLRKEGKPWRNRLMVNNVGRELSRHLKNAGIKLDGKFSIHTLRKSCGQNWADVLPMNVVKELMGHADISTTAEFYNQVDKTHRLLAANSIQTLLEAAQKDRQKSSEPVSEQRK
ncbi:MAG: hypothetical protein A2Y12_03670 [Planctomycetes bacterium GWF2_42_9]|nr:MAG: hypothetical protein A2Y12_03670 [Planctomycetes bacterium GWF2_42_9]